jgi:chromosome segregation protein
VFLKRIVLHGFKSFADRTEFEFGDGVTSIVGPNGCGKSNVLDAVRWVLGEQSARTLRGERMMDVIFAGSRSRRPANAAEVELHFNNTSRLLACDQDEVSVGRVLYRSGDSEYRLNGNVCRLRDVRDLLLDTGVGVDAYSIIEQGKVDVLLQANPIERREIFEEAAGISRYKVRRTEAQRKLERSQNNLLRLNDVVDELERQLRSVKLAAGKARSYEQHAARLRELRSSFALAEYHELERSRLATQERSTALADVLAANRAELASHDADGAQLEREVQSHDEAIRSGESEAHALVSEAAALAERIEQGQRRLGDLGAARRRHDELAQQAERRAAELAARLDTDAEALAALHALRDRQQQGVDALKAERMQVEQAALAARDRLDRERNATFDVVRRATVLQNEQRNIAEQKQRLTNQAEALAARQEQAGAEQADLERRTGELRTRIDELDAHSAELAEQVRTGERETTELESRLAEIDDRIAGERINRSGVLSRLTLLEEMEHRQEGVDQGARWLLDWRSDPSADGGVVGLVADVLQIDDARIGMLQSVLAGFEDHVVVRDAYAFLAALGRRGQPPGPVNVHALDRLPSGRAPSRYSDAPGFVACPLDWVRCDPQYAALAEHLLGRVVIVDVLERALALADGAPDGYRFVTLDGVVVDRGGAMTIGAARSVPGLISRKATIRQLRGELDVVETALERLVRERGELDRSLADARLRQEALLQRIAQVQQLHAEARSRSERLADDAARAQRERTLLAAELNAAQRASAELSARLAALSAEQVAAEDARAEHESLAAALATELSQTEATLGSLSQQLTAAMVELGRTVERARAMESVLAELRSAVEQDRAEQTEALRQATATAERIDAVGAEIDEAGRRREAVLAAAQLRETELLALREQRQSLRRRLEACGATARRLHRENEQIDAAYREQQVMLRELEVRKENLQTRIREELSVDLAALYAGYSHADQDWDAVRAEIEDLRAKIARLGNVNLDAIAELDELQPRYENLIAQRDDLLSSIQRLETLIRELDDESRTRFAAAFEQIREHFQNLFRKLFGGGKADIVLEDPERPLECGIDIVARPPGKEPRSISLLSGGEKTMTAVALLLAVFESKPSPFAILDEFDAALDESNIDRFNTVLQAFAAASQFVVITHSKRTMQCADVLYGVTMEEPGVSKRVSVRFDDCVNTPSVA